MTINSVGVHADTDNAMTMTLEDGVAHHMGDGMVVVDQVDGAGVAHRVALSRADLEGLLARWG